MPKIEAILATDMNGGIAKNGSIPWKSKTDMKFFKSKTEHNIVIMGSKTLLTLSKPLKNRLNIVLTNNASNISQNYLCHDNVLFFNYEELKNYLHNLTTDKTVYVIGGKEIYNLLIPICDKIWLTIINKDYECDLKISLDFETSLDFKISSDSNNVHKQPFYTDDELSMYCLLKNFT
jgi:dihydrofolate reductase